MDILKPLVEANVQTLQLLDQHTKQVTESLLALDPTGEVIAEVLKERDISIGQLFGITRLEHAITESSAQVEEEVEDDEPGASAGLSPEPQLREEPAPREKEDSTAPQVRADGDKGTSPGLKASDLNWSGQARERRIAILTYFTEHPTEPITAQGVRNAVPSLRQVSMNQVHNLLRELTERGFLNRGRTADDKMNVYTMMNTPETRQLIVELVTSTA